MDKDKALACLDGVKALLVKAVDAIGSTLRVEPRQPMARAKEHVLAALNEVAQAVGCLWLCSEASGRQRESDEV